MFAEQVVVLRYVFIIEIRNSKIQKYIKEKGKIKECDVVTIYFSSDSDLNIAVDSKYPKRLDQQIQ
jgi:hypothetical protein